MPSIAITVDPCVVYIATKYEFTDIISLSLGQLNPPDPETLVYVPISVDALVSVISTDNRITRFSIVVRDTNHVCWQTVATIIANLQYITIAYIHAYIPSDTYYHIPPLFTPSRIRVVWYESDNPSCLPLLYHLCKFVTHFTTSVDHFFLLPPTPSLLPSVTHLRITAHADDTDDAIYPHRLQSVIDRFPHLTYIDTRYVPLDVLSLVRIPVRQPPITVPNRFTANRIPPIPFSPRMSYLRRPLCQSADHPLGAVLASFFLAVDRITAIDPLVVLQISYHLTSRDGVDSPETAFIFRQ